jgi:phosphate/sulfate permease
MEIAYLILVIILLVLAVVDLIVGVSNDASNFLTSAVGAKAGTFKQILIVAAIGVMVGALSAGGMMEIARKGVFNPALFSFHDIIFIYIVVMLADIFLLDTFNTLKLPTSTTIAIVFNLLGASITTSMLKVVKEGKSFQEWGQYINTTKAIEMVIAIFVSVVIGFIVGWIVQYLMRAWVSFDYKKNMKLAGSLFGGISIVVVLNFIVKVGFKESALKDADFVHYINEHFSIIALATFLVSALVFLLLSSRKSFDAFRVVTLIGTFALAMAFASNDLINFIGVPLSSLEAYNLWHASGKGPDDFMMSPFNSEGQAANMFLLVIAGIIMVVTMFRSKKTKAVIETAVSLSRQQDGVEKSQGNTPVRSVVGFITFLANSVSSLLPASLRSKINAKFTPIPVDDNLPAEDIPAFDMVRASINLIVAASLVSIGTSMKLPLSTTYVSFMVLMGTSLADRAWNRDSAVYRVAGVFTVIGGWFVTALAALIISSLFVFICIKFQFVGVGIVIAFVGFAVYKLNQYHKETPSPVQISLEWKDEIFQAQHPEKFTAIVKERISESISAFGRYTSSLVSAIANEDKDAIRLLGTQLDYLSSQNLTNRSQLAAKIGKMKPEQKKMARQVVEFYSLENHILMEMNRLDEVARLHILNMHRPLQEKQVRLLRELEEKISKFVGIAKVGLGANEPAIAEAALQDINQHTDHALDVQMEGVADGSFNFKNSNLFLTSMINLRSSADLFNRMIKRLYQS